jgi:hypothetical protein
MISENLHYIHKCREFFINRWSQAAIAGILGEAIYAPYDITGNQIKYLNVLYQLVK